MTLENRVLPDGTIAALAARGLFFGNRGGRIHDPATRTLLPRRRWTSRRWICCVLAFKERQRQVMGHSYTELFFLDEVTALSAGHRPCFECRRADAARFAAAWQVAAHAAAPPMADAMDLILHAERRRPPGTADVSRLPDGTMVRLADGGFAAKCGDRLLDWAADGYRAARPANGRMPVLTPPSVRAALAAGYRPVWHPSAHAFSG